MIYIQQPKGLQAITSQLTKEKVIAALGYTPADQATFWEDESGTLLIADADGHVIARFDDAGLETTEISAKAIQLDGKDLEQKLLDVKHSIMEIYPDIVADNEEELLICDANEQVIMRVDSNGLNVASLYLNGQAVAIKNPLADKTLSIMGDSISTFEGYIPNEYPSFYPAGDVQSVQDTWWMKLIQDNDMKLGANVSASGTPIQMDSPDAAGACDDNRIEALGANGDPDFIIVEFGINDAKIEDMAQLGEIDPVFDVPFNSTSANKYDVTTFLGAYQALITKLMVRYPNATIACWAFPWTSRPGVMTSDDFYKASIRIEELCKMYGCIFLDIRKCGITPGNMTTYLGCNDTTITHPKVAGMELIANYIGKCLK